MKGKVQESDKNKFNRHWGSERPTNFAYTRKFCMKVRDYDYGKSNCVYAHINVRWRFWWRWSCRFKLIVSDSIVHEEAHKETKLDILNLSIICSFISIQLIWLHWEQVVFKELLKISTTSNLLSHLNNNHRITHQLLDVTLPHNPSQIIFL